MTSGFRAPAGVTAIRQLAAVIAELAAASTMDAVVEVSAVHMMQAAQAAVSVLLLVDGDDLVIAGHAGLAEDKVQRWSRLPIDGANPASEAVRTRRPTVAAGADDVRRRYPLMAADTPAERSVVCLPLTAGDTVLGAIGLTFENNWQPGGAELDFLMIFADSCAQTIRRVRATDESARRTRQLRFLADASAELAASMDYAKTLTNVARLAVPTLADWCAIDLVVDGALSTLEVAHVDPDLVRWARELRERYPHDPNAATGGPAVARTGRSELYAQITDEILVASARDDEHLRLTRQLNLRSIMIVALLAGAQPIGTITFVRTDSSPSYTDDDLAMAEDLGRRAGTAIENSRLHEQTASVALQFQRAVLPRYLDTIPDWEIASYYSPNGDAEVGGDFFDAVLHRDGRLSVFIGDVVGHGVEAAATMAQMRSAIRAFLTVDPDPVVVVAKLDNMFDALELPPFVTLVYALLDADGTLRFANAGHHPPLVVGPGRATRYLTSTPRTPIGIRVAGASATAINDRLGADEVLVLYTDGLIERRNESFDIGMQALAGRAHVLTEGPLGHQLPALIEAITTALPSDDDVAAIAIRRRPSGDQSAE